jgi:hypothetical protein
MQLRKLIELLSKNYDWNGNVLIDGKSIDVVTSYRDNKHVSKSGLGKMIIDLKSKRSK